MEVLTKLRKVGGSVMARIPKEILEGFTTKELKAKKMKAHHRAHSLVVKRPVCNG